jgi:hypothetical protein
MGFLIEGIDGIVKMAWSILQFGNYKGKTLPQVVFQDPDWFFWAVENGKFYYKTQAVEARELFRKATSIRIPQRENEDLVAEYFIHPLTGKFARFKLVPRSKPEHKGASAAFRSDSISLRTPRELAPYDKLGSKLMIRTLKYYLFGSENIRMTKKRCEDFFEDDTNFVL